MVEEGDFERYDERLRKIIRAYEIVKDYDVDLKKIHEPTPFGQSRIVITSLPSNVDDIIKLAGLDDELKSVNDSLVTLVQDLDRVDININNPEWVAETLRNLSPEKVAKTIKKLYEYFEKHGYTPKHKKDIEEYIKSYKRKYEMALESAQREKSTFFASLLTYGLLNTLKLIDEDYVGFLQREIRSKLDKLAHGKIVQGCSSLDWNIANPKSDESCVEYVTKGINEIPELVEYLPDFFSALSDRVAIFNDPSNAWVWSNPIRDVEGTYEFEVKMEDYLEDEYLTVPKDVQEIIRQYLSDRNYYFKKGDRTHAYYLDEEGREHRVKISKLIQKLPDEIKRKVQRIMTKLPPLGKRKFTIEITTDPLSIVKKSTGQFWSSCEKLGDSYSSGIFDDIRYWSGIAILREDGKVRWAGRVMIRACIDDKGEVKLGIEPRFYGNPHYAKIAMDKLKEILKPYLDYRYCVTPYRYSGYSDQMSGSGVIVYGSLREFVKDKIIEETDFKGKKILYCPSEKISKLYRFVTGKELRNELLHKISTSTEDTLKAIVDFAFNHGKSIIEAISECQVKDEDSKYVKEFLKKLNEVKKAVKLISSQLRKEGIKYGISVRIGRDYKDAEIIKIQVDNPDDVEYYILDSTSLDDFLKAYIKYKECVKNTKDIKYCFTNAFKYRTILGEEITYPIKSFEDVVKLFKDKTIKERVCSLLKVDYEEYIKTKVRPQSGIDFNDKLIKDIMVKGCGIKLESQ